VNLRVTLLLLALSISSANVSAQVTSADEIVRALGTRRFDASIVLTVHFEHDSDELTPQAQAQLNELGEALKSPRLRSRRFELAGHTDSTGDAAYNLELSLRRAAAAKRYLVERLGIPEGQIETTGYGEERPLNPDDPEAPENRRVEVRDVGRYEE